MMVLSYMCYCTKYIYSEGNNVQKSTTHNMVYLTLLEKHIYTLIFAPTVDQKQHMHVARISLIA
jgi:hypothetical protein